MRILRLALPMAFPDRSPAQDYRCLLWDTAFTGLFAVAAELKARRSTLVERSAR
jgi:hypothetical protein